MLDDKYVTMEIEKVKHTRYAAYESNTTTIVDSIEKYIKELV